MTVSIANLLKLFQPKDVVSSLATNVGLNFVTSHIVSLAQTEYENKGKEEVVRLCTVPAPDLNEMAKVEWTKLGKETTDPAFAPFAANIVSKWDAVANAIADAAGSLIPSA
jgi:hypothetical protein